MKDLAKAQAALPSVTKTANCSGMRTTAVI